MTHASREMFVLHTLTKLSGAKVWVLWKIGTVAAWPGHEIYYGETVAEKVCAWRNEWNEYDPGRPDKSKTKT